MELDALYKKAGSLIDTVKKERSEAVSKKESSLCVIISDDDEIFTGVTGIGVDKNGKVSNICSEYNAIMSMLVENKINAKQMITLSFADKSILKPCSGCIKLLYRVNSANTACQVVVDKNSAVAAETIESTAQSDADVFDQIPEFNFAADAASVEHKPLGVPAEFAIDAEADEDNPFYEPPINKEKKEDVPDYLVSPQATSPNYLYSDLEDAKKMGMSGYPNVQQPAQGQQVNPQQGYAFPQDGNGYFTPQQHGVPQGMNPQQMQQGYNPQPMQQGYNPMQQGYNPQPMQQGYNPQPMQQGYNPMRQGYNPMQQGYNPQPMQQQGMPQQQGGYVNAAPYNQNNGNRSLNVSFQNNGASYGGSHYQQSLPQSQMTGAKGSAAAYRQKVDNFMGKPSPAPAAPHTSSATSGASMEELLKQAKEKKKVAKVNSDFKKKMKDMGF